MFITIRRYLDHYRRFGSDGVRLVNHDNKQDGSLLQLRPKRYRYPISLRRGTSDIQTFYKIFYFKEYDIKFPITPKVILDCGANVGLASVFFSNKYPDAKIIAIEPEASNFDLLKKNTAPYPNVVCLQKGIWNREANLTIVGGKDKWGFQTLESDKQTQNSIPAIAINQIMEYYDLEEIDVLKIDIEGAEKELFEKNIEEWLPKTKFIVIELHDDFKKGCSKAFFNALSSFEYKLSASGENFICELVHE
jgi:FkbM family methyltransferase